MPCDDDGVTRLARRRGDDDAVADAEAGVGGEARVYCYGACPILREDTRRDRTRAALLRRRGAEGENEQEECRTKDHGDAG